MLNSKYARGIVICWICFLLLGVCLVITGSASPYNIYAEETAIDYDELIEASTNEREVYFDIQSLACKVGNQTILDETVTEIQRCNAEIRAYQKAASISEKEITLIAKTVGLEARGNTYEQKAMVAWCILNRVDCNYNGQTTITEVVTAPSQFAYHWWNSVVAEDYQVARDVVLQWCLENEGLEANRLLPSQYIFFWGDGRNNHFTTGVNATGIQYN